jgi:hypothetical protein
MTTTREHIERVLQAHDVKITNGEYRSNSPLRAGSDSHAFTVRFDGDEEGAWYDHTTGEGGHIYTLAKQLGIALPERTPVESSKRKYKDLNEYAAFKGVPVETFVLAGWSTEVTKKDGRDKLTFKTRTGERYRFLDGENPKFKSVYGYTSCWYGLDRAVDVAKKTGQPLLIVNGEPSVVVASHYGLPACAITGGEAKNIPKGLIDELKAKWTGKVTIALDCDEAGEKGARKYVAALPAVSTAIDLGMGKGGDIADFCKLHGQDVVEGLTKCKVLFKGEAQSITDAAPKYISSRDMHSAYQKAVLGETTSSLKPFLNPFKFLHQYKGFGKYCIPGKLAYFASISGGGKTIGFESGIYQLKKEGLHSIVYTPEWVDGADSIEMAAREVQRYGGMSFEATLDLLYWQQAHEGVRPVDHAIVAASSTRSQYIASMPGEEFYLTGKGLSVQAMCADIDGVYAAETAKGKRPSVLWVDFAQLLWLENDDHQRVWMETAINLLKDCCSRNNLFGFVSSQMKKSDAESAKQGKDLDSGMMQWLSEQQANFVFAFAPKLDPVGQRVKYTNSDGDTIHGMRGKILKNSMAPLSNQEFDFGVDFDHLIWVGQDE